MPLESPLLYKQLRHHVTERVRAAILEGQYQPGEWLRQERLAQDLGVSQMPVREALKELAAEGLVEHVPYKGVRVVAFSLEDVIDLYAHRAFLEGMAARAAARWISPASLAELREIQKEMKQHLDPADLLQYRELNRRFHRTIYSASRRPYLVRTLNQMWEAFPTMLFGNFARTAEQPLPEREVTDVTEHEAILAALESGDAEATEHLMKQHIQGAGADLVILLRVGESSGSSQPQTAPVVLPGHA
jgi:DNA-binding GntR family transcriptional regulator